MADYGNIGSAAATGAAIGAPLAPFTLGLAPVIGAGVGALGALGADILGQNDYQGAVNLAGQGIPGLQGLQTQVGYQDVNGIPQSSYDTANQTGNNALGDALTQLQAKYGQGGLGASDISKVASIQGAQLQGAAQARAAVQQEAQARGQSNSNLNYVSQLVGGQQAAGQALQASQGQAAIAEQQKTAELGQMADVGNRLQQNAYQVAGANDAIAQFNKGLQVSNSQNTLQAAIASQQAEAAKRSAIQNAFAGQGNLQAGKAAFDLKANTGVATSLSGIPQAIQGAIGNGGGNSSANNSNWNLPVDENGNTMGG
jgi:hypothetical protein